MNDQVQAPVQAAAAPAAAPDIQVMPIWHQEVQGFVAWSAVLSLLYFVLMPAVLFL